MKPASPHATAPAARREPEWVGGRVDFRALKQLDPAETPKVAIVWIEASSCELLGSQVFDAAVSPSIAGSLQEVMEHPRVGLPRRPNTVRVADPAFAAEVSATLGESVTVVIGPTPEVDQLAGALIQAWVDFETAAAIPASYLAGGAVPADTVERLFLAAGELYEIAPWDGLDDASILRLDIPGYHVHGAVVSILGAARAVTGFAIFPSLAAYEQFEDAVAKRLAGGTPRPPDGEPRVLEFTFSTEDEISEESRLEVEANDWLLPAPGVYPAFQARTQNGDLRAMTEGDARTLLACAEALVTFFENEPQFLDAQSLVPVCSSVTLTRRLQVDLTYPFEAHQEFPRDAAVILPARRPPTPGRNERCPCGSGKKFKHCHLDREAELPGSGSKATAAPVLAGSGSAGAATEPPPQRSIRTMDVELADRILNHNRLRFGTEWDRLLQRWAGDQAVFDGLVSTWAAYHADIQGQTALDRFVHEHHNTLKHEERAWLEAQRHAWLSVWDVEDCDPGHDLHVHDLLSGECRDVDDAVLSRILREGDTVLARVVDYNRTAFFSGIHPVPLDFEIGGRVVEKALERLPQKPPIAPGKLAAVAFGSLLLRDWHAAAQEFLSADGGRG